MNRKHRVLFAALVLIGAFAGITACSPPEAAAAAKAKPGAVEATPARGCGDGSNPETGIQGRVSVEDHGSGRAALGFTCNTELVGKFTSPNAIGTVAGFKVERFVDAAGYECAYYDTTLLFPTNIFNAEASVNVLDMSDPSRPMLTTRLVTPAMLSPHESLVLSHRRGLLAAVLGNPTTHPGVVDLYDLTQDCRNPLLRSSAPVGVLGHESGMAPDGKTFYAASFVMPTLTAVDISDPMLPRPLAVLNIRSHGLSISDDGNRAYVAGAGDHRGLVIVDTSEVQARKLDAKMKIISRTTWSPMSTPQNAIPITIKGHPYVLEFDEFGAQQEVGAARIIDIADETEPTVVSNIRLEVHQSENFAAQANDPGATTPFQGYAAHYCNVPRRHDPVIVACSMILSGLRVFDIRNPAHPREVAYFNAPVNPRITTTEFEASNWAMASPAFAPERKEIWYADGFSGFYAVRVTNGAWPDTD